jgi:hypothetical protein
LSFLSEAPAILTSQPIPLPHSEPARSMLTSFSKRPKSMASTTKTPFVSGLKLKNSLKSHLCRCLSTKSSTSWTQQPLPFAEKTFPIHVFNLFRKKREPFFQPSLTEKLALWSQEIKSMSTEKEVETKMQATLDHFKQELKNLRTNRANPGMVEGVSVEVYGTHMKSRSSPTSPLLKPVKFSLLLSIPKRPERSPKASKKQI